MEQQKFRLSLPVKAGESRMDHGLREKHFNKPSKKVPGEKLLADLIKRHARRAMQDVTECPTVTLPAHLARLDDLSELIRHVIQHELRETPESIRSGKQLQYCSTLADFLAAIQNTRENHRMPSFVNDRDAAVARIEHKLDVLAGLFAGSPAFEGVLLEEA